MADAHWFDLAYWRENFPLVRLNWEDNRHVDARMLSVPWTSTEPPPIVAVEIFPRELQRSGKPASLDWVPIASAVLSVIPVLGGATALALKVVKLGVQIEHGIALREWANSFHPSPDEFSPQYAPAPFLVPMPLDWAQIMVSRPWYAPAMVQEFVHELQTSAIRPASEVYRSIVAAMVPAGQSDPPAYTHDEAPLFSWVNPLATLPKAPAPSQDTTLATALSSAQPTTSIGQGSALSLFAAGALLLAGAPILLPIAIVVLSAQKKTTPASLP